MSEQPVDLPVPSAGGSYLRDDATGALVRISGPDDGSLPSPQSEDPQAGPVPDPAAPETIPAEEK